MPGASHAVPERATLSAMRDCDAAVVPGWAPTIMLDDHVPRTARLDRFLDLAPAAYVAPAIRFGRAEPLLVAGGGFVVVSAAAGLDPASVHTHGRFDWAHAFEGLGRSACHGPMAVAPVVAANSAHANYYHWTMQTLGTALMADGAPLVLPAIDAAWRRDGLAMAGAGPVIEVDRGTLGVFAGAVRTNLSGGDYAFAPHPAVLAAFVRAAEKIPSAVGPEHVYLSRLDAPGRRPLRNEGALADRLAARGFVVVETGLMPLARQIALMRGARTIVATHGAALTNLVYAADGAAGPRVIELLPATYPNRCFVKIGQAKGLRYAALIGRCVDPATDHHAAAWEVNVDAVERLVDAG